MTLVLLLTLFGRHKRYACCTSFSFFKALTRLLSGYVRVIVYVNNIGVVSRMSLLSESFGRTTHFKEPQKGDNAFGPSPSAAVDNCKR